MCQDPQSTVQLTQDVGDAHLDGAGGTCEIISELGFRPGGCLSWSHIWTNLH